jgi:hypothetical protein
MYFELKFVTRILLATYLLLLPLAPGAAQAFSLGWFLLR